MRQGHSFFISLCFLLAFQNKAFSQPDNTYLHDRISIQPNDSQQFGASIYMMGFMRNTEYFNQIELGRTLFGYQLQPKIYYQLHPMLKFEAGVFTRYDFGGGFSQISPTFSIKGQKGNFSMI